MELQRDLTPSHLSTLNLKLGNRIKPLPHNTNILVLPFTLSSYIHHDLSRDGRLVSRSKGLSDQARRGLAYCRLDLWAVDLATGRFMIDTERLLSKEVYCVDNLPEELNSYPFAKYLQHKKDGGTIDYDTLEKMTLRKNTGRFWAPVSIAVVAGVRVLFEGGRMKLKEGDNVPYLEFFYVHGHKFDMSIKNVGGKYSEANVSAATTSLFSLAAPKVLSAVYGKRGKEELKNLQSAKRFPPPSGIMYFEVIDFPGVQNVKLAREIMAVSLCDLKDIHFIETLNLVNLNEILT
jgi:hypothetical protein